MDQWEFEIWRGEFRRRNMAAHADQERTAVAALLARNRRRRGR